MEFRLINEKLIVEYENRLKQAFNKLVDEEGLKYVERFYLDKNDNYKGDFLKRKSKIEKALKNKYKKLLDREQELLNKISEANDTLPNPFIITVEWKNNKTWGKNPRAYTNYGFNGDSIGGCGYDKLSTATAEALNSNLTVLKRLLRAEERRLKENPQPERRAYIGYGSGYNIIPSFEGGVGVNCHESIIKSLGGQWSYITSTSNTDVFMITL